MSVNPRTPIWRPDVDVALGAHNVRRRMLDREIPQYTGSLGLPVGYVRHVGTIDGFLTGDGPTLSFGSTYQILCHKQSVHGYLHYQFDSAAGTGDQYIMAVNPIPTTFGNLFSNSPNMGCVIAQQVGGGPPEDGVVTPMWLRVCNDAYNSGLPGLYLEAVLSDGSLWGPSNPVAWTQYDVMISGTFTYFAYASP